MNIVMIVCGVLLAGAAILALVRAERGPTMLDRTIALDVFVTAVVGAIVVDSAFSGRSDTLPVLVVLSLVAFVGSVTIARFASVEPEGEGRIRTPEEIAAEEAERRLEEGEGTTIADAVLAQRSRPDRAGPEGAESRDPASPDPDPEPEPGGAAAPTTDREADR